jgi:hypothetical protein
MMIRKFFRLILSVLLFLPFPAACNGRSQVSASSFQEEIPEAAEVSGELRNYWELGPAERAERVMKALAAAYPNAVEKAEFRNDDWAVLMKGRWFYYADGRLLPEEFLDQKEQFARQSFYRYFPDLPEWKAPEGEAAERMKSVLGNRRARPPKQSPDFFDTLWDAHNRSESYDNLVRIRFLGRVVLVHRGIAERLGKVEARIQEAAKTDPALQSWIDNIGSVVAWNWRNVAASVSRSFHSYAIAVDIQPKSTRGLQTYWQWTADSDPEWYAVPYSERFHPPEPAIKAFEAYGFCWGGKWPLFDTMHFEYRPEIMLISGMTVEDL